MILVSQNLGGVCAGSTRLLWIRGFRFGRVWVQLHARPELILTTSSIVSQRRLRFGVAIKPP
jgi:hypothetical protein